MLSLSVIYEQDGQKLGTQREVISESGKPYRKFRNKENISKGNVANCTSFSGRMQYVTLKYNSNNKINCITSDLCIPEAPQRSVLEPLRSYNMLLI